MTIEGGVTSVNFTWLRGRKVPTYTVVTSEPVIVPPDPDRQFILYVDASQFATGAVLYQLDLE